MIGKQRNLRVYVAGAFVEKERAARWMSAIEAEPDMELTFNWSLPDVDVPPGAHDAELPRDLRRKFALADAAGVFACDVLWFLAPTERGSCGSWVELGLAIGKRKGVIVSGHQWGRSIFTELADARYEDDADAWEAVRRCALCYREARDVFFDAVPFVVTP